MLKNLYKLKKKDIHKATNVLVRAFHEDPLIQLIYPNPDERIRYSSILWVFLLRDGIKYGEVYSPTEKIEGVAKWLPPGREHMNIWRSIKGGAVRVGLAMIKQKDTRKKSLMEIQKITEKMTQKHKEIIKEPHWYLSTIGVDPSYQGKGYGSTLIKPMLGYIEKKGYPIYLETNYQANISLYEHLGFEMINEMRIPKTEIINWSMVKKI